MKIDRFMIAAPKKRQWKNNDNLRHVAAVKGQRKKKVASYKCGPDYIDPMFHRKVLDVPSKKSGYIFYGRKDNNAAFYRWKS